MKPTVLGFAWSRASLPNSSWSAPSFRPLFSPEKEQEPRLYCSLLRWLTWGWMENSLHSWSWLTSTRNPWVGVGTQLRLSKGLFLRAGLGWSYLGQPRVVLHLRDLSPACSVARWFQNMAQLSGGGRENSEKNIQNGSRLIWVPGPVEAPTK